MLRILTELCFGDELAKVDSARQGLQTRDIVDGGRAVVLVGLAAVGGARTTGGREDVVDVGVLYLLVQVDGVGMQQHGVCEWGEKRLGKLVGEEGIFIGGLVASYSGVHDFLLVQDPVEEGAGVVWDVDLLGLVDGGVQGELDAFDEVEDDGVFETAVVGDRSVEGGRKGGE